MALDRQKIQKVRTSPVPKVLTYSSPVISTEPEDAMLATFYGRLT